MQIKIIVNGAYGRMGKVTCETIKAQNHYKLVASLGRNDDLRQAIISTKPDIVIDFTDAKSVYNNSKIIINANVHPVIGATGLSQGEIQELQSLNPNLGGIIAPNFSISANLMIKYAAIMAEFFPKAEIIEAHHEKKLDKPSGTAHKTQEILNKVMKQDVPIHSLRLPGVLAKQEIIFGNIGETLTITHNSIDRECFMPGVILACNKVLSLDKIYYGLECLL
jgi:4-hydroxy-tetrahydrodipicolinate reductase